VWVPVQAQVLALASGRARAQVLVPVPVPVQVQVLARVQVLALALALALALETASRPAYRWRLSRRVRRRHTPPARWSAAAHSRFALRSWGFSSLSCLVSARPARSPQSRYGASVAICGWSVLPFGSIEYM
jgi:hypothetical protein